MKGRPVATGHSPQGIASGSVVQTAADAAREGAGQVANAAARTASHVASVATQAAADASTAVRTQAVAATATAAASAKSAVAAIKPKMRGWIHAATTPLVLAMTVVLMVLAPAGAGTVAVTIFGLSALLLFGNSAVYHIGNGRMAARTTAVLRRIDHANIFLLIAGTYTPLSVMVLPRSTAVAILAIVWGGASLGLLGHVLWMSAPRWVYVPVYLAVAWVAMAYIGDFSRYGGPAVVWLIVSGGLAYTVGAVVYGIKRPNPSPRWFGFHEIFHTCTVLGFACHTVAIFIAALTL